MKKIITDYLFDVINKLGILDAVKKQLLKQPDLAAEKLVIVLEELSKIYGTMEYELTNYLSLFFDDSDPTQLARERGKLVKLEGGAIRARMAEARGQCGKIWNIYEKYLTPWFQKTLNTEENAQLAELFRELSEVDSHMVDAIEQAATWLTKEAYETNELVSNNDFEEANKRIADARRELFPMRERITEAMIQIRRLEGAFIEISGAV